MMYLKTDEFGECLTESEAKHFLNRQGVGWMCDRGVLMFGYKEQPRRIVHPLFIQGKGWYFQKAELVRDYVKPAPEVVEA